MGRMGPGASLPHLSPDSPYLLWGLGQVTDHPSYGNDRGMPLGDVVKIKWIGRWEMLPRGLPWRLCWSASCSPISLLNSFRGTLGRTAVESRG